MRYIIFEDERFAYEDIKRMMGKLRPDYQLVGWAQSVEQGSMMLRATQADLVISDIRLEDGLSMDMFDQAGTDLPIIFTTAYDEYALRAFDLNSVGYLLKPIQEEKLEAALKKVERNLGLSTGSEAFERLRTTYLAGRPKRRFLVRKGNKGCYVPAENVAALYADSKYCMLQTFEGQEYIINYTMDELEKVLNPERFFCVTRGVILSIDNVKGYEQDGRGWTQVVLKRPLNKELRHGTLQGDRVTVARDRLASFRNWLDR